jgi:hypothetical protein
VIRWSFFLALAAGAVAYSFWFYLRVELPVQWARRLAVVRASALVILLLLLFDLRLPAAMSGGGDERWVLLDASLSMGASEPGGRSAWEAASSRARSLDREGWTVVTFGGGTQRGESEGDASPTELESLLAPALDRAVEAGVRRVRVLSDMRFEDAVAVRSALESLPLDVELETFGENLANAGVSSLAVPDLARADGSVTAQLEVHGGATGDSLTLQVFEEGTLVAERRVPAPSAGLRARVPIELPTPQSAGRLRYTARVVTEGDAFPSDDEAVAYANVGSEESALVVLSVRPDWEPRYLLPVLEEVTGLPGLGYIRAGADRWVPMGRAIERGSPADSASVRTTAQGAALLVLHGLSATSDAWVRALVDRSGPEAVLVDDPTGAELVGITTGPAQDGEWYVSSDIPTSPIAGSLVGTAFQGLPPLTSVLLPDDPARVRGSLFIQLRGAGPLEAAVHLEEGPGGRTAVLLASGLWRWASRPTGREAYRHLWSGIAGWLLGGESVPGAQPRPTRSIVERGRPVAWSAPSDSVDRRIVISRGDSVVTEVEARGRGAFETGVLPPGQYAYRVRDAAGDSLAAGRFDVAESTEEMTPAPMTTADVDAASAEGGTREDDPGSPLRTEPWPYLLVIGLLCGEWIGRRRSGLR